MGVIRALFALHLLRRLVTLSGSLMRLLKCTPYISPEMMLSDNGSGATNSHLTERN